MTNKVNIIKTMKITFIDYPSIEDHAMLILVAGCEHDCNKCHSKVLQHYTPDNSISVTAKELYNIINCFSTKANTNKVVLSGGDPLSKKNYKVIKELLSINKKFKFCIYTGHSIEEIKKLKIKGFDFLKCGKYIEELKQESGKEESCFKLSSTNQEIYDKEMNLITKDGIYYY